MNKNIAVTLMKKFGLITGLLSMMFILATPVHAGMISTDEMLLQKDRAQLIETLERDDVQQQLVELGVDPIEAKSRINQMTGEEIAQLNGQLAELPAGGATLGTVELLLIIIIIVLII